MAVAVVFAVRLVVLVVVGDEIAQGEAVVRSDEIDARPRFPPAEIELVGRRAKSGSERLGARHPAPVISYGVAERVVPLGPARREAADLVAARAAVPWLRDELDFREQRILSDRLQKAALGLEAVGLAREDRAEIEAEPVDPHFAHPVAQGVGDHLDDARMAEVQRVSGSRVVDVVARLIGKKPVIGAIVDALERKGRTELIALGGVVVDHVEDHLEPAVMQAGDHLLELAQ